MVSENASRCVTNVVDAIYFLGREWKFIYETVSSLKHFLRGKFQSSFMEWVKNYYKDTGWKRNIVEYLILIGKFNPSYIE